jgi:hypothetical protein
MRLDRSDVELLLDAKDGFQVLTMHPSGRLEIEVLKEDGEKKALFIKFPSEGQANAWVNTVFKEFGELERRRTIH